MDEDRVPNDRQVVELENLIKGLDELLVEARALAHSREVSLVITKLQEVKMWAGQGIAELV